MRRIAAIVLSRLPSELARRAHPSLGNGPLAVVISDGSDDGGHAPDAETEQVESSGAALVGAVDEAAARLGVQPGMRVSEAMARTAEISFARLSPRAIDEALALVAEVALGFGPVVEVTSADTVVIDITGVEHLFAGENVMQTEMVARVAGLGFRALVAISDGPFLAQALARYAGVHPDVPRIAPPGKGRVAISPLPVSALGLGIDCVVFFGRLGVLSLAVIVRIDLAQLAARLGPFVASSRPSKDKADAQKPALGEVLAWLDGIDARPLVPYEPAAVIVEHMTFEDGVESAPQLVFAVRGLVARLSSRLSGRRQACNRIDVSIRYDRAILLLKANRSQPPSADLAIDLPAPLSHTDDLFRAIKAKLESLELMAPAVAVELRLSRVVRAPEIQLDLSRDVSVSPDALPALLSELSAEIGVERVGVLATVDDHRPEKRSQLVSPTQPIRVENRKAKISQLALFDCLHELGPAEPARLLPRPVPLGLTVDGGRRLSALRPKTTLFIGKDVFTIQSVRFDRRIDGVAWWSKGVVYRDYLRVTLAAVQGAAVQGAAVQGAAVQGAAVQGAESNVASAEAWVFVDRHTGEAFLHGWWE